MSTRLSTIAVALSLLVLAGCPKRDAKVPAAKNTGALSGGFGEEGPSENTVVVRMTHWEAKSSSPRPQLQGKGAQILRLAEAGDFRLESVEYWDWGDGKDYGVFQYRCPLGQADALRETLKEFADSLHSWETSKAKGESQIVSFKLGQERQ